jgi:hypothetical protein
MALGGTSVTRLQHTSLTHLKITVLKVASNMTVTKANTFCRVCADTFEVDVSPRHVQVYPGDNVTLMCHVTGTGHTSVTWISADMLTSEHHVRTLTNGSLALEIYNVTSSDHFLPMRCAVESATDVQEAYVRLHVIRKWNSTWRGRNLIRVSNNSMVKKST